MKKALCVLLALSLMTAGLPVALSEAIDEESPIAVELQTDPTVAEVGDDLLELPVEEEELLVEEIVEEYSDPDWDDMAEGDAWADILPEIPELSDTPEGSDATLDPDGAEILEDEETVAFPVDDTLGSDELFAGYVNRFFYSTSRRGLKTMATFNAGSQLTGQDLVVYNALKAGIIQVAAGERSSTSFSLPVSQILGKDTFSATELGVTVELSGDKLTSDCETKLKNAVNAKFSYIRDNVLSALWLDCTYELYWLDRYQPSLSAQYKESVYHHHSLIPIR